MPLQSTSGAASYDAFGGGVAAVPKYIEDYFSTYLVTGDGTAPAVNNGIDLSTKGGLVWTKKRSAAGSHSLFDTARGANLRLISNDTAAQDSVNLSFTTTGFSNYTFDSGVTYTSWSWAKAPKFFDVVTYTGTGSLRTIAHNLGSVPGCIIIKNLSDTDGWLVYHRSIGATKTLSLNSTGAADNEGATYFNDTEPTSTVFTVKEGGKANQSSNNYVAYLFAHNAGGFGLTGTDNVISCGSFSTNASTTTSVNLGYEPQWLMIKRTDGVGNWYMLDNMRGLAVAGNQPFLLANSSNAEASSGYNAIPTATGFDVPITSNFNESGYQYIYIAIRRGPMKVPTSGTSVFSPNTANASAGTAIVTNFPVDLSIAQARSAGDPARWEDRLRGVNSPNLSGATPTLRSDSTAAESTASITLGWDNTQIQVPSYYASVDSIWWNFRRAPSFFDEVCYTGTGGATTVAHNLQAVPQLILVKQRTASPVGSPFTVYSATLGNTGVLFLNSNGGNQGPDSQWNSTTPTSSVFSLGSSLEVNQSGSTFVAYLFSTCAGVSKVGSYTGTGTTLQVDCGFTSGARFVLIKRSGTGDWYVWDSARGIVSGNDSYLLLNSTAAEVTNTDYIDTYSAGFEISSTAPAAINASGGSFIFFAVA